MYRVKLELIYDHSPQIFDAKYVNLDDDHLVIRKATNQMLMVRKKDINFLLTEDLK